MSRLIAEREQALAERLDQMRENHEWLLFQNFVLGLLPHDGYTDVRLSAVQSDFGRDAVALTPDGKKCFVAVSFDGSLPKVRSDAQRWTEDPNREDAEVMLFVTCESPQTTTVSKWVAEIRRKRGLELRLHNRNTILSTGAREGVWRETCARLGIPGHRQGYVKVSPYSGELVRRALRARPPKWLRERVPLAQWEKLSKTLRNRLILGRPGSGKTTTIFTQLELAQPKTVLVVDSDLSQPLQIESLLDDAAGGAAIVIDDLHDNPTRFMSLCEALRARRRDAPPIARQYDHVILLAAARSKEWADVAQKLSPTLLYDVGMLDASNLTLTGMDVEQCRHLIEICRREWDLAIEDRLLKQAAQAAAQREGTPLYVISMLAGARSRADRKLLDEHLVRIPDDVRGWWQKYWEGLDATSQGVLRLIRLFWAAGTPPQSQLLIQAAKCFEIPPANLTPTLDALERSLWLTRTAGVPTCLDTQLEVIDLDAVAYALWEQFLLDVHAPAGTVIQLRNATGAFYCQHAAPRAKSSAEYQQRLVDAARHFASMGNLAGPDDRFTTALALNNTSVVYGDLAGLETTLDGRRAWLEKAVAAVEESITIKRELRVRGDLAGSLNNASNLYLDLAGLETTRERLRAWLGKAVAASEEAVHSCRGLPMLNELATCLNSVSNVYLVLAGMETTRSDARAWLQKAVAAVDEAIRIYRELAVRSGLARSLNNASNAFRALAGQVAPGDDRRPLLGKAVAAAEEAACIHRELRARAPLAAALSSVSAACVALALETAPEGRVACLDHALTTGDEAVCICRQSGVPDYLAKSLINASNAYGARADLERTRDGRRAWLDKALAAIEESIAIRRELGLRGDLALSLGSLCQHARRLAETETDPGEAIRRLASSRAAIDEAVGLFRHAGNTPYLLLSLQDAIIARLLQAQAGATLDGAELTTLVDEGLALAKSMQDEQALGFFADLKQKLAEGTAQ